MSDCVLFETLPAPEAATEGAFVGVATLNSPATLNSLTLDMIDLLGPQLDAWRDDPQLVCVVIRGSGDRAFCAGGDIQALQQAINENQAAGEVVNNYPETFFEREYRLDYALHCYPKPVVVLGGGVVMGGGLGIFAGGSVRVVTPKSRIALPEITIGLFPDAGASWLLSQLPSGQAAFLGLTGSHLNGGDALACGLGTHAVAIDTLHSIPELLASVAWSADAQAHQEQAGAAVQELGARAGGVELPVAELLNVTKDISLGAGLEPMAALRAQAGTSDWIDKGLKTMNAGCPTSLAVVCEQLRRVRSMSLSECFQMEMIIAAQCARHDDFAEGVRALLVDKDNNPQWTYATLDDVPQSHVDAHFTAPWPVNPLNDI